MFPTIPPATVESLASILSVAVSLSSLSLVQRAHAQALTHGLHAHPFLATTLVSSYARLRLLSSSRLVFDSSPLHLRTVPSIWNSLLAAYSCNSLSLHVFRLFNRMRSLVRRPDNFTLSIVSKAAAVVSDFKTGAAIHSLVLRLGFDSDAVVSNSIMVFYFKCGCLAEARVVFDEMPVRSVASWNAFISEIMKLEEGSAVVDVWKLVMKMQQEGLKPDGFTISVITPLCGCDFGGYLRGREIHGFVVRHGVGIGSDFHVGCCLIDMYSRGGRVDVGRKVFDRMANKNVVAWTAMVGGYIENGEFQEALVLFRNMQLEERIVPNKVTLVTILPAIGSIPSLEKGRQIHCFAIRAFFTREASVNNALIDMYSKCGSLDSARCIFDDKSWDKDAISWSSMILSYGIHGKGEEALGLFDEMCSQGTELDHISSVGILSACARSGLVNEGILIFEALIKDHRVHPTVEICSCIVNMLGRAGLLNQALDFIKSMPLSPGPSVWGALFDASVVHNNQEIQDLTHKLLMQLEPENASNYVSLSNLRAASGRWDSVIKLRTKMLESRMRKMPGCSWINVNNEVHSFYVADKSHQYTDIIYTVLDGLLLIMKATIIIPELDCKA